MKTFPHGKKAWNGITHFPKRWKGEYEGILVSWKGAASEGALPLIAVVQLTKNKVRHALDFRGLGDCVKCNTSGDIINVYTETLRKWRQRIGVTNSCKPEEHIPTVVHRVVGAIT